MDAQVWHSSPEMRAHILSFIAATVALSPPAARLIGIVTPDLLATWIESVFGLVVVSSNAYGAYHRAKSSVAPLTLTKNGAVTTTLAAISTPALLNAQVQSLAAAAAAAPAKPAA